MPTRLHVAAADTAVRLGPAPAAESYLRADAIIEAARATGAEAIHPGYGFLSERAAFARAVDDAGLVVRRSVARRRSTRSATSSPRVGPRAGAGVPVVPGTFEPRRSIDPDDVGADRRRRPSGSASRCWSRPRPAAAGAACAASTIATELPAALAAGSAEARRRFGDGAVYLEREVRPARHIEVQLLGDADGTIVALGERDCSIQRRHQKLVEEIAGARA